MLTIKTVLGLTGGAALLAAGVEAARQAGDSVASVLLVVSTVVALMLTRRTHDV